jgi:beta-mannosidase
LISDLQVRASVDAELKCHLAVNVDLRGDSSGLHVAATAYDPAGKAITFETHDLDAGGHAEGDLTTHTALNSDIANIRLWWPSGYGEQPLYEIEVKLKSKV